MFHDGIEADRCEDCIRTESQAAENAAPDGVLALPQEAFCGFPDGVPRRPRGLNRRELLRNGAVGVASIYGASQLSWDGIWEAAIAEAAEPMQKSLVMIYLNGGNDGVNCFVPVGASGTNGYANYLAQRGVTGRDIARVQPGDMTAGKVGTTLMPNGDGLGFANPLVSGTAMGQNGDTKGFDTLWGNGDGSAGSDLAIFPATDYNPSNQSHFESRDYYFQGAINQSLQTGWLGRWLDRYGSAENPLQAIALDTSLSKMIRTSKAPVCALTGLNGVKFRVPDAEAAVNDATPHIGKLAGGAVNPANIALARSRATYGLTVDMSNRLGTLSHTAGAGYPPGSYLSSRLQLAATLLSAGLGTRVITIEWGSFDTHGDQVAGQDPQLAVLSRALAAFKADLTARGIEQNVVTCVFSEFGRRCGSNEALGTDHGAGGPMMVMGSKVYGGLAGEASDVNAPDRDGNLVVKTDFRTVYQALISEWLGGDPAAVLPGNGFPGIDGFLSGHNRLLK